MNDATAEHPLLSTHCSFTDEDCEELAKHFSKESRREKAAAAQQRHARLLEMPQHKQLQKKLEATEQDLKKKEQRLQKMSILKAKLENAQAQGQRAHAQVGELKEALSALRREKAFADGALMTLMMTAKLVQQALRKCNKRYKDQELEHALGELESAMRIVLPGSQGERSTSPDMAAWQQCKLASQGEEQMCRTSGRDDLTIRSPPACAEKKSSRPASPLNYPQYCLVPAGTPQPVMASASPWSSNTTPSCCSLGAHCVSTSPCVIARPVGTKPRPSTASQSRKFERRVAAQQRMSVAAQSHPAQLSSSPVTRAVSATDLQSGSYISPRTVVAANNATVLSGAAHLLQGSKVMESTGKHLDIAVSPQSQKPLGRPRTTSPHDIGAWLAANANAYSSIVAGQGVPNADGKHAADD